MDIKQKEAVVEFLQSMIVDIEHEIDEEKDEDKSIPSIEDFLKGFSARKVEPKEDIEEEDEEFDKFFRDFSRFNDNYTEDISDEGCGECTECIIEQLDDWRAKYHNKFKSPGIFWEMFFEEVRTILNK